MRYTLKDMRTGRSTVNKLLILIYSKAQTHKSRHEKGILKIKIKFKKNIGNE
jgi:hypothetical protein